MPDPTHSDNIRLASLKYHDSQALFRCQMLFADLHFLLLQDFHGQAMQVQLLYQATYIPFALKVKQEDEDCVDFHNLPHFDAYVYFRMQISHKSEGSAAFANASNDLMLLQACHNLTILQVYYLL